MTRAREFWFMAGTVLLATALLVLSICAATALNADRRAIEAKGDDQADAGHEREPYGTLSGPVTMSVGGPWQCALPEGQDAGIHCWAVEPDPEAPRCPDGTSPYRRLK